MKKIELTNNFYNKNLLRKVSLNITEIREVLGIGRDKTQIIVKKIRNENKSYYNRKKEVYGTTSISPLHLMMYVVGWTREEFMNFIK